jgi:D-alanyl-D-alanine carboxypeptidase
LIAAVAADADKQTSRHAKKTRVAGKKPETTPESKSESKATGKDAVKDAKPDKKPEPKLVGKPSVDKHANAKPEAGEKSATAGDKPALRPAKPKPIVKPSSKPKSSTIEAMPADQKGAAPRS